MLPTIGGLTTLNIRYLLKAQSILALLAYNFATNVTNLIPLWHATVYTELIYYY